MTELSGVSDKRATRELAVGDRVRLRSDDADSWIDPKIRRRAQLGRHATISSVIGTALREHKRSYRLDFDCVGREKPFSFMFERRYIEAINNGQ